MPDRRPANFTALFELLPGDLLEQLVAHCARTGDAPKDVVADAVALHLEADSSADSEVIAVLTAWQQSPTDRVLP